jgi:hypothetical protein
MPQPENTIIKIPLHREKYGKTGRILTDWSLLTWLNLKIKSKRAPGIHPCVKKRRAKGLCRSSTV